MTNFEIAVYEVLAAKINGCAKEVNKMIDEEKADSGWHFLFFTA